MTPAHTFWFALVAGVALGWLLAVGSVSFLAWTDRRRLIPAPPVLPNAEWAAVLAAVSPPLDWSVEEWAAREREVTS